MSSSSEIPIDLSQDGLRYMAHDYQILRDLSTFDVQSFVSKKHSNAADILGRMSNMATNLLNNPRCLSPVDQTSLQAELAALKQLVALLREQLPTTMSPSVSPSPPDPIQAPPQASTQIQAISIADPKTYNGNRDELRSFVSHLRIKLQGDANRFPNAQHQ